MDYNHTIELLFQHVTFNHQQKRDAETNQTSDLPSLVKPYPTLAQLMESRIVHEKPKPEPKESKEKISQKPFRFSDYVTTPAPIEKIESAISPIDSHNFFRHAGKIIGSAAYAHIGFELRFDEIKKGIDQACTCSTTDIASIFPNVFNY